VAHPGSVGVVVVMVTAQFPDVVVATVPRTRSSRTRALTTKW